MYQPVHVTDSSALRLLLPVEAAPLLPRSQRPPRPTATIPNHHYPKPPHVAIEEYRMERDKKRAASAAASSASSASASSASTASSASAASASSSAADNRAADAASSSQAWSQASAGGTKRPPPVPAHSSSADPDGGAQPPRPKRTRDG